jgi:transmembrane sensor
MSDEHDPTYFSDPNLGDTFEPDFEADDFARMWGNIEAAIEAEDADASRQANAQAADQPGDADAEPNQGWKFFAIAAAIVLAGVAAWAVGAFDATSPVPEPTTPGVADRDQAEQPTDTPAVPVEFELADNSDDTPEPEVPYDVSIELAEPVALADATRISPAKDASRVRVMRPSDDNQEVVLESGAATFEVTRNPERTFRVRANDALVTVLGTTFTVERIGEQGVRVTVEEGHVRVTFDGEDYDLRTGDAVELPKTAEDIDSRPKPAPRAWVEEARRGEHEAASKRLLADPEQVRDTAEELMLAADALRLAGKEDAAIRYLDRVLQRFPNDRRASLAAFTKARLLLAGRRDLAEAAGLFARVPQMKSTDRLKQDALAREVEAWHRAGDYAKARERALEYLEAYPDGDRTTTVKQFGGITE